MTDDNWEQTIIQKFATEYLKEKRRKRRWGMFFKISFLIIFLSGFISLYFSNIYKSPEVRYPHTALINIQGPIFVNTKANADNTVKSLRMAYKDTNTVGIILRINSPGGSPVQASFIFNEIMRLRKMHPKIKVYAVCTDACASAAYYIAAAADEIYADPSSIVGSIGVLYNGFGFVGAMQKLGLDRRLVTSGKNKAFMDPFSPLVTEQKNILHNMLASVHQQFKNSVRLGRGKRLKQDPAIFSGLFWTGIKAKQLGLIDGFGSPGYVAREIIKNTKVIDYTVRQNYLERLAKRFDTNISNELMKQLGTQTNSFISEIF